MKEIHNKSNLLVEQVGRRFRHWVFDESCYYRAGMFNVYMLQYYVLCNARKALYESISFITTD